MLLHVITCSSLSFHYGFVMFCDVLWLNPVTSVTETPLFFHQKPPTLGRQIIRTTRSSQAILRGASCCNGWRSRIRASAGGSSHLSGLVQPNYKWIKPTKIPFITGVISHLRAVGWATKWLSISNVSYIYSTCVCVMCVCVISSSSLAVSWILTP